MRKEARVRGERCAKNADPNSNYGNSADFAIQEAAPRVVCRNSKSIFAAAQDDARTNGGAGLSHANSAHQFLYFNGKKETPLAFANLIRNADREDVRTMYMDVSRFDGQRYTESAALTKLSRLATRNRRNVVQTAPVEE